MGEIVLVLFLGIWLMTASILGYRRLKNELSQFMEEERS